MRWISSLGSVGWWTRYRVVAWRDIFWTYSLTSVAEPVNVDVVIDSVGAMFDDCSDKVLGKLPKHPDGRDIHCP